MKKLKVLFMTILISIFLMGCGQVNNSVSIPSENNTKEDKGIFGITEMKRVDSDSRINLTDSISFPLTALIVLLL